MKRPFIFATGGTGGHIFPALAIAEEMCSSVIFAGHGIEENEYLKQGIHEVVSVLSAPPNSFWNIIKIMQGVMKAISLLRKTSPLAVIGFGSYHTFPLLVAAKLLRIPIILFEPNSTFGKVNKLFSKYAQLVLSQFPIIPSACQISMPIKRFEKLNKEEAKKHYHFDPERKVVLVMGGSQGAKIFEQLVFPQSVQVLHLGGKHSDCDGLRRKYSLQGIDAIVMEFEDEMRFAWSAADYVVCRSGAMTIAEHLAYQVPALFIPFPHASDNHQFHNAEYIVTKMKSGVVLKQDQLSQFETAFQKLISIDMDQTSVSLPHPTVSSCIERYHFIGAGGIGMSSLIHILRDRGVAVSGSDMRHTPITRELQAKGANISTPQVEQNIPPFAQVVYSTAISASNPEYKETKKKKLPLMHRSALLSHLCEEKVPLLVTGTHGKTSVSALLSYTLVECGADPMYAVGGIIKNYGKNGAWGEGRYAAVEADESDGSFLHLPCHSAILTNIEPDHLDYYRDEKRMLTAYRSFISQVKHHLVWCADDPKLQEISPHGVSYGFSEAADVRIIACEERDGHSVCTLEWEGETEYSFAFPQYGEHIILNVTGVFVLLKLLGFDMKAITRSWSQYQGVGRRMECIGAANNIDIYDDYAHHPTEVLATLKALRKKVKNRRIVSVFQPHRFSRFQQFSSLFANALEHSDSVIITDIYAAGEKPIENVDAKLLLSLLKEAEYVPRTGLTEGVRTRLQEGDVVITLGAGDVTHIGKEVLALLEK